MWFKIILLWVVVSLAIAWKEDAFNKNMEKFDHVLLVAFYFLWPLIGISWLTVKLFQILPVRRRK